VEKNIVGFQITMHDIVLIESLEGLEKLPEDEQGLFLFEHIVFSEESLESAAIAVLVDEVEVVLGLEHVEVGDDVLVLLDICQNVDLIDRALLQLFVGLELFDLDDLDGVLLVVQLVGRSVNLPVGSFSDDLVQSVVLDDPYHSKLVSY
jgi:hypothetical protein